MWAMTSGSFGAQILVYRVEQEVASPKVREALCEIRLSSLLWILCSLTMGWVREGKGFFSA